MASLALRIANVGCERERERFRLRRREGERNCITCQIPEEGLSPMNPLLME